MKNKPQVALVYDRVNTSYGGAENVLLALKQLYPQAPLFTALYQPGKARWAKDFTVKTSFLNNIPVFRSLHRWLAMLMPLAFESLDLKKYDLIISVTSAEAKGVITGPDQLHLCYLLTPTRYLYHQRQHSLDSHPLLKLPVIRQLAKLMLSYLRWWDQAAIFRPDVIIPISQQVSQRMTKFYPGIKPAKVIYPPINIQANNQSNKKYEPYLLAISRLVSHKKLELAIKACGRLNKKLVIVGNGPEKNRLKNIASTVQAQVTFLNSVSPAKLSQLYQHCQALIMPGEEDFGIVALEANSYGKPVIINAHSGAAELIKDGVEGIHLKQANLTAVIAAIKKLEQSSFSASKIKQNPLEYSTEKFLKTFSATADQLWQATQKAK